MSRWIRRTLIVIVALLVAIQFVRPARINPPTDPVRTIHAQLGPASHPRPSIARVVTATRTRPRGAGTARWPRSRG